MDSKLKQLFLTSITSIILMTFSGAAAFLEAKPYVNAESMQQPTLKSQMEEIHRIFGVNFVYDSSIDLDIPYKGKLTDESPNRKTQTDNSKQFYTDRPEKDRQQRSQFRLCCFQYS